MITSDGLAGSAARLLPVGSIIVTTRATLGETAIAAVPLTTNQGFKSIVPNDNTEPLFTYYHVQTLKPKMLRLASGTTFLEISKADFSQIRTRRPKREEQSRIAAVLDAVDVAIAKTEAVIAKLRQVRTGLLHDLLTRGLDHNGQPRDPIAHPEQFQESPVGPIPHSWSVQTLEQITDPEAPICYGIVQSFDFIPDGVPVLAIRDLLGDYVSGIHRTAPSIDATYARSRVRAGDVLISIKGTIGRVGLVPPHYIGNISRDLARVRPIEHISPAFLIHLLRSPVGQKMLELARVGTTRAELSIAPLKRINFSFPSKTEQDEIARILNSQDSLIDAHVLELSKLQQLKSGLIADLLTGCVRVPESSEIRS
jgi:type I restriction enzyme S subunit